MSDAPPPVPPSDDDQGVVLDESRDQGEARTFPCTSCGADLEFHIGTQNLKCGFCGHEQSLDDEDESVGIVENDLRSALEAESDRRSGGGGAQGKSAHEQASELSEVRCDNCGAQVRFLGTLTADDCPYCGTPLTREGVHDAEDRIPVDGVLPFAVERAEARENLGRWIKGLWFAPNDFLKRGVDGKFEGCYLPFWTYDALTMNAYSGQRGEHYYVTVKRGDQNVRERRTRWYPASGRFRRFFDDVLVLATKGLPRKKVRKLEPWPLKSVKPYDPGYLSGFLARTYDLSLKAGFDLAEDRIDEAVRKEVQRRIGGDEQRIHSINTRYGALSYKHLLLPCWLLAYRFGDKTYQVVVNAVTGEVQGERPWSAWKIAVAVLLGLGVVGVIVAFASGR